MPSYPELGRHTPPPPPYSSNKRNWRHPIATLEDSQSSNPPPPPPPTSYSTQAKKFRLPSPCEFEQPVASSNHYLRHSSVAIPAPPVLFQDVATQPLNPGQPIDDHGRNNYRESIRFGIPVEPKLASGSRGRPLRPLNASSLESSSEPLSYQSLVYNQGAGTRPEYDTIPPQPVHSVSSSQDLSSDATQTPLYGVVVDRQSIPICRRYSSTTIPSVAYPNMLDAEVSVGPSGTIYPPSTLPSQQAIARPPTIITQSTEATKPKSQHVAPPAQLKSTSKDYSSQGQEQWRRVPRYNARRPPVSVRYDPYKKRQASIAGEKAEQLRLAGMVENELAKETRADSDAETEERERKGEGEHKR